VHEDTVSFLQEIRSESPAPQPLAGKEPSTPFTGKGVWLPQAMKNPLSPVIASEAHVPSGA